MLEELQVACYRVTSMLHELFHPDQVVFCFLSSALQLNTIYPLIIIWLSLEPQYSENPDKDLFSNSYFNFKELFSNYT